MCKSKTGFSVFIAIFIVGCSATPPSVVISKSDPAVEQLARTSSEIASYERKLYEIEAARYKDAGIEKVDAYDMYFLPALNRYYGLGDNWSGPIEPLLEKISELAGLNPPRYINVPPSTSIVVYVDTKNKRLIDTLADAGNQAGQRVKVTLKMRERLLQVEYAPI